MGLRSLAPGPNTSRRSPAHPVYPYLLRDLSIDRPGSGLVCGCDLHPDGAGVFVSGGGYGLAFAVRVDVATVHHPGRGLLPGSLAGRPGSARAPRRFFNTNQGSQFPSRDWTEALKAAGIQISMDGKGRWLDNVFIERLWRSLKQECVYLNAFDSMRDATGQIGRWIAYYNRERPHSSLGGRTPFEVYMQPLLKQAA